MFLGWFFNILRLRKIIRKKKIQVIHPWCTIAGAAGAILKIWDRNLKLYIDSFEPHAETMAENKTWKKTGLKYKVLFRFEKIEAMTADYLVFAAPGMENYILEKFRITVTDYSVKPACIDLNAFSSRFLKNNELLKKYNFENKIVCVYAGKFGGIYLEDETFEFVKACENYWGKDKFRFLLLSNATNEYVNKKNRYTIFNLQQLLNYLSLIPKCPFIWDLPILHYAQ